MSDAGAASYIVRVVSTKTLGARVIVLGSS